MLTTTTTRTLLRHPPLRRLLCSSTVDKQLEDFAALVERGLGAGEQLDAMRAAMKSSLDSQGFFACDGFLGDKVCAAIRHEVESLHAGGHFEQSYSQVAETGEKIWRGHVDAMELGSDTWRSSPTLVALVSEMMRELPPVLNSSFGDLQLSSSTFGHKLACTTGHGGFYPKHLDNTIGPPGDTRKLTAIYYINPEWDEEANGGAIRLYDRLSVEGEAPYTELAPTGDRLLLFWSDLIVHEVLPSWGEHRYTFTFWFSSDNPICIGNPRDPMYALREAHYPRAC